MTAREQLDAYVARPLPDHVDTIGFDDTAETFAPEAIAALRAVLDVADEMDQNGLYAAYAFRLRTAITTALEAS
ncbi:hypothetical protein [Amycolatopsis lurida]|uniref:hypothetical protein n=1 Tax=Amycolatopsis lurida TaxID=31959 RepID=UPI00366492B1